MTDSAVDRRDDHPAAVAQGPPAGLWRSGDFVKLWSGQTISVLGSAVTGLALPVVAIQVLHARPFEVGLVTAAWSAPFLLSLFFGVWVDRHRRLPILIGTNLGRAVIIGMVPLAALLGVLGMPYLYVVAFLMGLLTVPFDLAYLSYLPSLVERRQLVAANSRLVTSATLADIGGRPLAGLLIELLSAPFALVVDAVSYLCSAASLAAIDQREPTPSRPARRRTPRQGLSDIRAGLKLVFGDRNLRALAGQAGTFNLFQTVIITVFQYYALTTLGLSPFWLAIVLSTMAVGAFTGSLFAARLRQRLDFGPALLAAAALGCGAPGLLLLVTGGGGGYLAVLALAFFTHGVGLAVTNILAVTFRQSVTPHHLQGRMHASYRLLIYGSVPVGALLGGALGGEVGLRAALAIGVVGLAGAFLWLIRAPIRLLRELPRPLTGAGPGDG
ncbi:MAG TPA: MFS transporter [Pseudonocardiaceae bacterium]|jgi:MFS family permease|nr:MFS transporter [Pseudonocardiaceae bacterium]